VEEKYLTFSEKIQIYKS